MGTKTTFRKDPAAVLDYAIDWSAWLAGPDGTDDDTIQSSSWGAPDGITVDDDSNTDSVATVWLSGGTAGQTYQVTNHIVTAAGRETDQTILIVVQER